ncbi:MAG: AraC family transcriptional regulator [Clostridium celatum]|uniref:AraC family transcriptional regulator n=1 Tax=Clostridium sp. TaxID=1506 RepID=UPI0025F07395|nr:AraC family transcriptional regulator [uncultured Clostridium sp.]MDU4883988.1 AraC family transcriptional regulator [Clostridium celatum]MDU5262824.1 AraC family transcriptional regulator [Clostridium celatum]MDU7077231.1 AraC family transcriptional regulator [Clostridium celatum]
MSNTRYNVNEKNIYNIDFELLYISKSKYGEDWHSTSHFHPFTEIFFITHGNGIMEIDSIDVSVKEGDLIIINPNCPHTEKSSYNRMDQLEYIVFAINNLALANKSLPQLNGDDSNPTYYKIMNLNNNKSVILYYLNTLVHEVEEKKVNYELACKSILTLFIIYISRNTESNLLIADNPEKLNIECVKIKNYIDSHYSENITLDILSNLSYVNKFHLVHLFTKQMGISPINYLINRRIEESKNLLTTTNYSIRDISTIVGFSNSSYFSQMFKKFTGYSPRMYKTKYTTLK